MMSKFNVIDTTIDGLKRIIPFVSDDTRGNLVKYFEKTFFEILGNCDINDVMISNNAKAGIVRGLHFQTQNPQDKYVFSMGGKIYDVAVDLRRNSPTFGKYEGFHLEKNQGLFIPKGFAHGYQVLEDNSSVLYLCCGEYLKDFDTGIIYNDADLDIKWIMDSVIISERDKQLMTLKDFIVKHKGL